MATDVEELVSLLYTSLSETLSLLAALDDHDLDSPCQHPCAMGGTVRDLLTHNIDHERMHAGQVYSARYSLKQMQRGQAARLAAETLRARADLMASLIELPDEALDVPIPDEDWTVRQMIDHTIYWERHSMQALIQHHLRERTPADRPKLSARVVDPDAGPLDSSRAAVDASARGA